MMKINQDKYEQLISLLNGNLKGKKKSLLLNEIQKNTELSDMYDMLKKMDEISPKESKATFIASKKLSLSLFRDFLKEKANTDFSYGVQVFDSTLLPLPEGIRPATVDTRQLKYQVGDFVVELTVYPITIDSVELIGQIRDFEKGNNITVSAVVQNKKISTEVDEFGLFRFERIDAGDCKLLLSRENSKEGIIELKL